MLFYDPKTDETIDDINTIRRYFCLSRSCELNCPLYEYVTEETSCRKWVTDHPAEAARLMGYMAVGCDVCAYAGTPSYKSPCSECRYSSKFELRKEKHWTIARDGDGLVCPYCGADFCTIIHETERFKHCPNCGKALLPPMGNSESNNKKRKCYSCKHYKGNGICNFGGLNITADPEQGCIVFEQKEGQHE